MILPDYVAIGVLIVLILWAVADWISARQVMIRAAEYKHHAQECREQAKRVLRPEDRQALERLAQIWEKLADVREHHPELGPEPEMSLQSN